MSKCSCVADVASSQLYHARSRTFVRLTSAPRPRPGAGAGHRTPVHRHQHQHRYRCRRNRRSRRQVRRCHRSRRRSQPGAAPRRLLWGSTPGRTYRRVRAVPDRRTAEDTGHDPHDDWHMEMTVPPPPAPGGPGWRRRRSRRRVGLAQPAGSSESLMTDDRPGSAHDRRKPSDSSVRALEISRVRSDLVLEFGRR